MAATFDGSITPPPPVGIRTPPTPRLGYNDNWEPFTPRKSARISQKQQRARTPSPHSSNRQPRSPRTAKKSSKPSDLSPMRSPQKRRQPAMDSVRRASGSLAAEGSQAAAALGIKDTTRPARSAVTRAAGMLPTPSKTPQKPPNEKTATKIKSIARNLFPSEADSDLMPSPKKRRAKKYTGISMESFRVEEVEEDIEIFTDTQDRIPSKDESESNPFYGELAAPPSPSKRRAKARQVRIPGEGVQTVDEASRREDGMVYVFRGKKFFRKWADFDTADLEELEDENDEEARLARPLTRSAIKPRLLFQTKKTQEVIDEEEAATDVEDQHDDEATEHEAEEETETEVQEPQTPAKSRVKRAGTPEAPKFAPVSPPSTRRTTRSTNKLLEEPTPVKARSRGSPFDSWRRTKKEDKAPSSLKRHGESLASTNAKRTRN